MRKALPLITLTFLLLCVSGAIAQNSAPNSVVIVEQTPCAPVFYSNHSPIRYNRVLRYNDDAVAYVVVAAVVV